MTTISFVGKTDKNNAANTDLGSITLNVADMTGTPQVGDVMIAYTMGSEADVWTPPSGSTWTLFKYYSSTHMVIDMHLYYRVFQSGDTSWTWTQTTSMRGVMGVGISVFRGVDTTTPVQTETYVDYNFPSASTNYSSTGVTTTYDNAAILTYAVAEYASPPNGVAISAGTASPGTLLASYGQFDAGGIEGRCAFWGRYDVAHGSQGAKQVSLSKNCPGLAVMEVVLNPKIDTGSLASTMPHFTAALGAQTGGGQLVSSMPSFTADLEGAELPGGPLACTLPNFTSHLVGERFTQGSLAATMPGFSASFGGHPIGVRIEMLVGDTWTDITHFIRYESGVDISSRGRTAEGTTLSTTVATLTLDNRPETTGSRFSISNPDGMWYGLIGRNTQLRIVKQESGDYRFWGEVSSWKPGSDPTNNDQYVEIEASGILRRLEAGSPATAPAIQREIMAASPAPVAYWPCDEDEGSTSFGSGLIAGAPLSVRGLPDYGNYTALRCSTAIPQISTSTWGSPVMLGTDLQEGITITFLLASPGGMFHDSLSDDPNFIVFQAVRDDGTPCYVELTYDNTNHVSCRTVPMGGNGGSLPIVGSTGMLCYLGIQSDGTDLNVSLWYQQEGDSVPQLCFSGAAAPLGVFTSQPSFRINPQGFAYNEASSVYLGQIAVWNGFAADDVNDLPHIFGSVGAYAGETAGNRFLRLCEEEGIAATVNNPDNSTKMGAQLAKATTDLLRECEATDLGIMSELRNAFGLGYTVRRDLYNQEPALVLDYSNGDVAQALEPVYDDKDIQNDVTVTRDGGSSARYKVTTGPLSIQAPPYGVGEYETETTVSLEQDEQCYAQAGWRAYIGTAPDERVSQVGVELASASFQNDPSLEAAAFSVDSGSRMKVINTPVWMRDLDQIVQGYSEHFDQYTHEITYNTAPGSPYVTSVVPDTPSSATAKAGSLTSSLGEDIDETDTSFTVADTSTLWTRSGNAFDINIDGERMTVTAVSGTSSPQTFTVTRSVNGVVKSHSSGANVRLWQPVVLSL